jgi:hypothetical protein
MNDVGKNRALSSPFHKKIVLICNHVLLKNLDLDIADQIPTRQIGQQHRSTIRIDG